MAERATADRVAADMRPPNFRGAVQRLRTIKAKKERIAGITSEIGGIFDAVEGFKVNKKAAKIFLPLDALEPDERADIIRSLKGLIEAAGWTEGDLVDQAEGGGGNIIAASFGRKSGEADPAAAEQNDKDLDEAIEAISEPGAKGPPSAEEQARRDAEFEAAAPKPETAAPKPETPAQKRQRIKAAHEEGKAPAPDAPQTPYTGDNSDLAGE